MDIAVRELRLVAYMIRRFHPTRTPASLALDARPVLPTSQSSEHPDPDVTSNEAAVPLVTVITSAYNIAPYIRESALSALKQTYSNLELIVIDDGSTDGTLERIEGITDARLRILKRPHQGQAAAMNAGIAEARGDYIALLDGDDVWLPQKLEHQLAFHVDHPDVDMTYSGSREIDAEGNIGGLLPTANRSVSFRDLLIENPIHNGSVAVVRKNVLDEVGGFDNDLAACHDLDMWLRLAKLREGNIFGISEPLTLYRRRPDQTSSDVQRMAKGWSQCIAKAALVAPDEVRATESARQVNLNRYFAYVSYQARQFGAALRYMGKPLLSSPIGFVMDRRNVLLAGACLSGILLPASWHQALYLRMRERYDRTVIEQVRRANES